MQSKSKEQHVHAVFESIAPKYDLMNDLLSFRRHKAWRAFTMRKMDVKPGETAIDLCCGTCDWTIALARASKTGEMVGLDFSQHMLDYGQQKVNREGLDGQISLIHGNAMELPFEDNHFDYATIGFGLRNVPNLVQVLKEMKRVVKPGGQVFVWNCPSQSGSRSNRYIIFISNGFYQRLASYSLRDMNSTNGFLNL